MRAPENTSKPRVLCPRGAHLSRLVQVVDLGTQHFKPTDDGSRKIYFGFETVQTKHVFKEENGEEPFMLQIEFAWYMTSANPSKPTKLRQFLTQWFGRDFKSEQEARDFDFSKLLGRLCMITVAHKPKTDGSMKAAIADIYKPTPELEAEFKNADSHNTEICFEISNGEDANFKALPEFLQKKIRESDEFKSPQRHEEVEIVAGGWSDGDDQPGDDIPF